MKRNFLNSSEQINFPIVCIVLKKNRKKHISYFMDSENCGRILLPVQQGNIKASDSLNNLLEYHFFIYSVFLIFTYEWFPLLYCTHLTFVSRSIKLTYSLLVHR